MNKALVIGSLNMDLVVQTQRAPEAGETVSGDSFRTIPGGKGANQAAAIGRVGGQVAMVGRVGDDAFGARLRQNLAAQGVHVAEVRLDSATSTGTATIIVDAAGENRIIVVAGANGRVDRTDVDASASTLQECQLLVLQLEIPLETVAYALEVAERLDVPALLNPAPAYPLSDDLLCRVRYLILNESEARLLTGRQIHDRLSARAAAVDLRARGAQVVVLTLGAGGAVLSTPEGCWHIPAAQVKAVDTTAAGDAFIGGLAVSLLAEQPLLEAVRVASACGALAVTRFGAQTSLPSLSEVNAFLAEHTELHPDAL